MNQLAQTTSQKSNEITSFCAFSTAPCSSIHSSMNASGESLPKKPPMTSLPTIYPSAIARAVSALDELAAFKELPDGFLRVIVRIIRKINLRAPCGAIVASRARLAAEAGKSVAPFAGLRTMA